MNWSLILDVVSAICLISGSALAVAAAVGFIRFPDLLTRMHAATKPQTLGLTLLIIGVACRIESVPGITMLALTGLIQIITAPISAHMVSRSHVTQNPIRRDLLIADELHEPGP